MSSPHAFYATPDTGLHSGPLIAVSASTAPRSATPSRWPFPGTRCVRALTSDQYVASARRRPPARPFRELELYTPFGGPCLGGRSSTPTSRAVPRAPRPQLRCEAAGPRRVARVALAERPVHVPLLTQCLEEDPGGGDDRRHVDQRMRHDEHVS